MSLTRVDASDLDWWNNPETSDNEVFTTSVPWVELILPENTRALNFNVGASFNGWGWTIAMSDANYGSKGAQIPFHSFDLGPDLTPGVGIYADNSQGHCESISSVIIDPREWGFGNLSIAQSENCTPVSVPEPGVTALLSIGLLGLAMSRRQQKRAHRSRN